MRRAPFRISIAFSTCSKFRCSRNCRIADTVLSSTFAPKSVAVSPRCLAVAHRDRAGEAGGELQQSDSPWQPSERQKRITVGWLTSALRAMSTIGSLMIERGWFSARSATRRRSAGGHCDRTHLAGSVRERNDERARDEREQFAELQRDAAADVHAAERAERQRDAARERAENPAEAFDRLERECVARMRALDDLDRVDGRGHALLVARGAR